MSLKTRIHDVSVTRDAGRICEISGGTVTILGLNRVAHVGDILRVETRDGDACRGEVLRIGADRLDALLDGPTDMVRIGGLAAHLGRYDLAPDHSWLGRVIDPFGAPLDGRPLMPGPAARSLHTRPPAATERRALGDRLDTGLAAFNTFLPLVRGQRVGLFAGSGVGKSTLLAGLARSVSADVSVIALIGERGREVREFVESTLGAQGMKRAVVIAATSDQSALVRRRAAWAAMTVAEYFRDCGQHVLFMADSVTRFAEAHRELALVAGEAASLRGYPPSTAQKITSLAERAGPGADGQGDITAIFSVLVAGSDMEEPVADTLRGVLDGHVVLEREIAERGRFPAIDLSRSVSRSLPHAATEAENKLLARARHLLGRYERAEMMIQSGLYSGGTDAEIDAAIALWPKLEGFLSKTDASGCAESFAALAQCLDQHPARV
nr:FliI/YscN family ATPase [Actibacterium ureilyticum]